MEAAEDIPFSQKIAIVGIGCRFAGGADTVEGLWDVLDKGRDCSSSHPETRYDVSYYLSPGEKLPGKMYNLRGSYLSQDPMKFDKNFFKMSLEEAQHLDPAIRILLEVTWEALEDAGISAAAARGSHTGVYIGGMNAAEYRILVTDKDYNIGQYTNSGNTSCMYANRLSYEFDFRGPSLALDTACSSSLSAIFLACEALKTNQCPMAIAGGLNIQLLPHAFIGLCQANMVSPDGRSKSFDKSANGYGRGEGFGLVVLKTVENAIRDGDRIYAVIRGGALSNDGRTTGIIAPSAKAQRKLLRAACRHAKVTPRDITYAEAHGTGTALGDKTEATVLGEVFGKRRSSKQPPLHVGSIKSNLGHTEGAAGVAGMIKVALSFKHQCIPKVVHFVEPNPELDFKDLNLHVPKCTTPWPAGEPYIASCSSFGFGGANACMIMEDALKLNIIQGVTTPCNVTPKPTILVVSAATKPALQQRLRDWVVFLQSTEIRSNATQFQSALYTAAQRSHHHQHRLGLVVTTAEDTIEIINRKLGEEDVKAKSVEGVARSIGISSKVAFMFSGMGTQWWGMARELMKNEPIFPAMIKKIDKKLKSCGCKWSLVNMLTQEEDIEKINETDIAQPCICAVQIALVDLWRFRGILPDVVVGHSVGEVAAAYCAGLLTLEQAISLIYHRSKQLCKTSGSGTMMAVLHPADEVVEKMRSKGYDQKLDIAAINSPNQVVISGDTNSINDLKTEFESDNIRCVQLKVRNAFHSRQQACLEKKFKSKVSKFLRSKNGSANNGIRIIPMLSTVTGRYMTREEAGSSEYWWKNIRQQVQFKIAVETLLNDGYRVFLEIGPHQALTPAVKDTISRNLQEPTVKPVISGSLVRPRDTSKLAEDRTTLLLNHAQLWVSGVPVDFSSYFDKGFTTTTSIPKYPWQRELCTAVPPGTVEDFQFPAKHHPLLGEQQLLNIPTGIHMKWWKSKLTKSSVPWLKDHLIGGAIIFPAAAYIEVSLTVARIYFPETTPITLQNVDLQKFMYVPKGEWLVETTSEQLITTKVHATIRSCDPEVQKRTLHMETDIVNQATSYQSGVLDVKAITARCNVVLTQQMMEEIKERSGMKFGPSFQTTTSAFVNDSVSEIVSFCEAPDVIFREFNRYIFHPALLDACLQSHGLLVGFKRYSEALKKGTLIRTVKEVPRKMKSFSLYKEAPRRIVVHLSLSGDLDNVVYCDITIADTESNDIVAVMKRVQFQRFETDVEIGPNIWSTNWVSVPDTEQRNEQRRCLIIPDQLGICSAVEGRLQASGVSTVVANVGENQKNNIQQYFEESPSITDILVLQPLDMITLQDDMSSTDGMRLEGFRKLQHRFPLFWKFLLLEITDLNHDIWPRVIFITAGAHKVFSGENVNSFMCYVHSLLMTEMYEEPRLRAGSVDVPLCVDVTETSSIIHEAFLNISDDENVLAYRRSPQVVQQEPHFTRFAPRMSFEPTGNFRVNTGNQSWIVQNSQGAAKLSLRPIETSISSEKSNEKETMSLHAFCIIPVEEDAIQDVTTSNGTTQSDEMVTIYAGEKRKGDHLSTTILAISNTLPQLSASIILDPNQRNYVELPDDIDSINAIHAVKEYLPARIFFHDILQLTSSAHVLFLADSETSSQGLSFPSLAYARGARVTFVAIRDNDNVSQTIGLQQNGNCKIINIEDVNTIGKFSVDLLIVPMSSTSLQKEVPSLLGTLKKSSTTLYLYDGDIKQSTVIPGMSGLKIMTYTTSLPKALSRQSSKALLVAVNDICGVLKQSRWIMKDLETSRDISLSQLPLVKGRIPHSIVITVKEEHTKLPFELYSDLWVAEKDASYLVTGGTSGFGLCVVKWLVSRGATYIFIISRQTPDDDILKYFTEEKAAKIQHYKADVSSATDIEKVLITIRDSELPPLVGIFHLAVQYRDGFLHLTTQDRWNAVMEVKAYGALLLHQLTLKLNIPLKYFVVSSSIVSLIGNAGQGNYCAANNFLNSLCHYRRHQGLPATALCIGFINSVGYASSNDLVKVGEERGMMSLDPAEVLRAFNAALTTEMPVIGIAGPLIRRRFIQKRRLFLSHHFSERGGRFSLFKGLFADMKEVMDQSTGSFRQTLQEKPEEEAKTLIIDKLCQVLKTQLGTTENIDIDISLLSSGLDSLLATSVSEAIHDNFEVSVSPVELINESMTVNKLQVQILNNIKTTSTNATIGDVTSDSITTTQNRKAMTKPWLVEGPTNKTTRLKMICFPPTGGGASFFTSWSSYVVQFGIQLLMVQLPGWEGRETEKPIHVLQEIVGSVTAELIPRLEDRKFVLFGHSMGSLIAFETAHRLLTNNLRPRHMFLSGWYAPTLPYPHPEDLKGVRERTFVGLKQVLETGDDFFKYASRQHSTSLSFLDDTILNNRVLLLRLLPAIESTFNIIRAYRCEDRNPLPCELTVFGGKSDPFAAPRLLGEWKRQVATGYRFKKLTYEGKHMFILGEVEAVLKEVELALRKYTNRKT